MQPFHLNKCKCAWSELCGGAPRAPADETMTKLTYKWSPAMHAQQVFSCDREESQNLETVHGMEMFAKLFSPIVVISLLVACSPTEAWYKQTAGGPSYYSVGRASGLLSGIRRSPYAKRGETEPTDSAETVGNTVLSELTPRSVFLKTMVSVKLLQRPFHVFSWALYNLEHVTNSFKNL